LFTQIPNQQVYCNVTASPSVYQCREDPSVLKLLISEADGML